MEMHENKVCCVTGDTELIAGVGISKWVFLVDDLHHAMEEDEKRGEKDEVLRRRGV